MGVSRFWIRHCYLILSIVVLVSCESRDSRNSEVPPSRTEPGTQRVEDVPRDRAATRKVTKRTQWDVTWFTITGEGIAGATVGTTTLGATFDEKWGKGPVYEKYSDYVGFTAIATINMPRTGMATFRIGSDDGAELLLDNNLIINNNRNGSYVEKSAKINLDPGKHRLAIKYYEFKGSARVSFDCDHDLQVWEEDE